MAVRFWRPLSEQQRGTFSTLLWLPSTLVLIGEIILWILLAILSPVITMLIDRHYMRKHPPREILDVDPKGYSINDLAMLNLDQSKDFSKLKVVESGAIDLPGHRFKFHSPDGDEKRAIDFAFDKVTEDMVVTEGVEMLYIEEFQDCSYLSVPDANEVLTNQESLPLQEESQSNIA